MKETKDIIIIRIYGNVYNIDTGDGCYRYDLIKSNGEEFNGEEILLGYHEMEGGFQYTDMEKILEFLGYEVIISVANGD